ncbi:MAG: hypothetical protein KAS66_14755 [Candidatus Omnitrophica bacterium]|nr:hypothetical protein [Candidatus Omnitrophota bacterium]
MGEESAKLLDLMVKLGDKKSLTYIKKGHDALYLGNTESRSDYQRAYIAIDRGITGVYCL